MPGLPSRPEPDRAREPRRRVGYWTAFDNAYGTRQLWRPPIARCVVALYWWVFGVPASKYEEWQGRTSAWDVMSTRERWWFLSGVVVLSALLVVLLAIAGAR